MLHPVGPLSAAVYWRRRVAGLVLVLVVVAAAGWGALSWRTGRPWGLSLAAASSSAAPVATDSGVARSGAVHQAGNPSPAGAPCAATALAVRIRSAATAATGQPAAFHLVVTNGSAAPCLAAPDTAQPEIVLVDESGQRVWSSADCHAGGRPAARALAPGEVVELAVAWNGLSSEPTCTAPQVAPPAGSYLLRGRLDTAQTSDVPLNLQ